MKTTYHKWTSCLLIMAVIISFIPPMTASAAGSRITITSPYVAVDISSGRPAPSEDNNIPRYTSNPIVVSATIENISDAQIPSLYLEITNVSTNTTRVDNSIKASRQTGSFDITFTGVNLTEGLNKITVKLGDSTIIESAPGWAYYTATTNITNLEVDNQPFIDNKIYPENPETSTSVNISGNAPNADQVQAFILGDSAPKSAYFNNGTFFFIADDINKTNSTANFKLKPGDNQLTIIAANNSKNYQADRNLIYDNGKPFAFNATIKEIGTTSAAEKLITSPTVTTNNVKFSALLKNDLNALGDVRYRYVDVLVNGVRIGGPYDLSSAQAATTATALYPDNINQGYSETFLSVAGTALEDGLTVEYENNNGVSTVLGTTPGTDTYVNPGKTTRLYRLPAGALVASGSPYKFTIFDGTTIVNNFTVLVNVPVATLPTVNVAALDTEFTNANKLNEGYAAGIDKTVTFNSAVTENKVRVDILDLTGQSQLGTATGTGAASTTTVIFDMPTGLAEGEYKIRISYDGSVLTDRHFTVSPRIPTAPTVTTVATSEALPDFTATGTPPVSATFIKVTGTDFTTKAGAITNARLVNKFVPADTQPLTLYDISNTQLLFKLGDQSALTDGATYNLAFDHTAGSPAVLTPLTVSDAVYSEVKTIGTGYGGAIVTGVSPLQLTRSEVLQPSTSLTVTGEGFVAANMLVEIFDESGIQQGNGTVSAVNPAQTQATLKLPTTLIPGNYLLRITSVDSGTRNFLAQYPLAVLDPNISSLDPAIKSITAVTPTKIIVNGSGLGRFVTGIDPTPLLKLKFVADANSQVTSETTVQSIEAGSIATFPLPNLPEGTYTVSLLYNNAAIGNTLEYGVSSPPAGLKENSTWSKPNRYKVFEFETDLTIPPEKEQLVEFKFYNFITDAITPRSFNFHYVNPNLPYIDHVTRGANLALSEVAPNEINELPATLQIYADKKTEKVNVYVGDYNSNSVPYATIIAKKQPESSDSSIYNIYTVDLQAIANGQTKLTIIPSTNNSTSPAKSGENISGKKVYDLSITSIPYVIINNIYNGMVVKDPVSEIACDINGISKGKCISGRLVNVPAADYDNVEVEVNGTTSNLRYLNGTSDFSDPALGRFNIQLGAARGIDLKTEDGKNTIRFLIYRTENGVKKLITQASFEIFVFSKEVSEFITINPIETTSTVKYKPGTLPDTYVTTENTIAFSGQFANATEIKLTVRRKDEFGQPIVKYDRRYSNFLIPDPANGNPGFFSAVNSPTNQFTTIPITIDRRGDTIFEFAITNDSGVIVTRVITITREPRPYVVLYPTLVKNSKGEDQAYINSNFIEIEMEAENADSILFGKAEAVRKEVVDGFGDKKNHFYYEVGDLKAGTNKIQFTVKTGDESKKGSFIVYNSDTPIEGAKYKSALKTTMKVFDDKIKLVFPKGSNFMRSEPGAVNPYLSADRKILFGIANQDDGRVDKFKHPAASDGQIGNPNPFISPEAKLLLTEPTGRFRQAGELFWIDAGTIAENETDISKALSGSGRLPYDPETFYNRNLNDFVIPTQRGKLTLKYDPVIRDDAWKYLTVLHFDTFEDHTGIVKPRWRNLGGTIDFRQHTITVPFDNFGYYQVMYMDQSFDDVTSHPWARNDLDTLYSKGIMLPKAPPSSFVPNDPISRGEFTTMLVKIFDIPLRYTEISTFTDVLRVNPLTNGLYDYKYIETAASAGIVRGYGGGRFIPDNSITRQDAAVMIAKAANLKLNNDNSKVLKSLQKSFTDANDMELYAQPSIEAIAKAGLIQGKENLLLEGQAKATFRFDPRQTLTRSEAAVVAINVLRQQKKIPK